MQHSHPYSFDAAILDIRQRIASEQAAMHRVQLAVARWRGVASAAPCHETLLQARWNSAAQDHFIAWLEGGGFAAELDTDCDPDAGADTAIHAGTLVDGLYPEKPCRCAA